MERRLDKLYMNADIIKYDPGEKLVFFSDLHVIEDGEWILGDVVNIAARLKSLFEAGGICNSGNV
jgi:hypothetical protein